MDILLLYLFGATALVAAASMLVLRHPMRVALALIACMLSLAGIYGLLGVHAIAVFQVLIYVGAVMVFMVYAIMLLDSNDPAYRERYSSWLLPALAVAVALLMSLSFALVKDGPVAAGAMANTFDVRQFSVVF